jgi:hypothetical protein
MAAPLLSIRGVLSLLTSISQNPRIGKKSKSAFGAAVAARFQNPQRLSVVLHCLFLFALQDESDGETFMGLGKFRPNLQSAPKVLDRLSKIAFNRQYSTQRPRSLVCAGWTKRNKRKVRK